MARPPRRGRAVWCSLPRGAGARHAQLAAAIRALCLLGLPAPRSPHRRLEVGELARSAPVNLALARCSPAQRLRELTIRPFLPPCIFSVKLDHRGVGGRIPTHRGSRRSPSRSGPRPQCPPPPRGERPSRPETQWRSARKRSPIHARTHSPHTTPSPHGAWSASCPSSCSRSP